MEIPRHLDPNSLRELPFANLQLIEIKGGFNNKVGILQDSDGVKYVAKVMDAHFNCPTDISQSVPALNNNRIKKEVDISNLLTANNFATPHCVYFNENTPNFAIFEWANGTIVNFNEARSNDMERRIKFANDAGAFLGTLITAQDLLMSNDYVQFRTDKDATTAIGLDSKRINILSNHLAEIAILSHLELDDIQKIAKKLLPKIPDVGLKLIHGDIYTGNLFVDSNNKPLSLIDWSDSAELGDPLVDIVLTARWIAFEGDLRNFKDSSSVEVFMSFLNSYNSTTSSAKVDLNLCYGLIPIYDLIWHLQTLALEYYKGKRDAIDYFKTNLLSIMENSGK